MRFGQIKKGQHFMYRGQEWKRTRGGFAKREVHLGEPGREWPFNVKEPVEPMPEKPSQQP